MRRYWPLAGVSLLALAACSGPQAGLKPQVAVGAQVEVSKTAVPAFKRTYTWTIEKKVLDPADGQLTLALNQAYVVRYGVYLVGTPKDSDFKVSGEVKIRNTGTGTVFIQTPTDTLSSGENVALDCGVSFPYKLEPGQTLVCTYTQALPDGQARTNTVSVPWKQSQNPSETPTVTTAQAAFSFTNPTEAVDGSVTVEDPSAELESAISGIAPEGVISQAYFFKRTLQFDTCGEREVPNTATFTTNTTQTQGSASATVQVKVPCPEGCTLTQGYWKTHSRYGPAPYDPTWALLGEDTPFYGSSQTYHQVLWTAPRGNAYYLLAHQYIAAKLNVLKGTATVPEVDQALAWAEGLFSTYTPTGVPKDLATQAKAYATTLDNYNNGLVGPGHCSEQ